jgi:hypothetical protein
MPAHRADSIGSGRFKRRDTSPFKRLGQAMRLTLGDDDVGVVEEPVYSRGGQSLRPWPYWPIQRISLRPRVGRLDRDNPSSTSQQQTQWQNDWVMRWIAESAGGTNSCS